MIEIELKFKIKNKNEIINRLIELGFSCGIRKFQITTMYDNTEEIMKKKDGRIRIRTWNGTIVKLSYKKPISREGIKKEIEYEVIISEDNKGILERIFKKMGFEPVSSYEKYRTTFEKDNIKAEVDEYPFATYLEIEGEEKKIKKVAKQLEFDIDNNLTESCDDLFAIWRADKGLPPKSHLKFFDYNKT